MVFNKFVRGHNSTYNTGRSWCFLAQPDGQYLTDDSAE